MRLHCWLFGCEEIQGGCVRCGAEIYDFDFVQYGGWNELVFQIKRIVRPLFGRRCDVCGKRFWRHASKDYCCSPKCYEGWVPF
jgi:hypothetical protein